MGLEACELYHGGSKIEVTISLNGRCFKNTLDTTLGRLSNDCMMNVYCECGRLVWLDRTAMNLKLSMGKPLECSRCRNKRISEEIELLDRHFNGEDIFADE
ncbi:MAG: hypothetical protein ACOX1N_04335 [Candidatus Methanomethylophilaceae archaeon]|jgi:hypothetical protein